MSAQSFTAHYLIDSGMLDDYRTNDNFIDKKLKADIKKSIKQLESNKVKHIYIGVIDLDYHKYDLGFGIESKYEDVDKWKDEFVKAIFDEVSPMTLKRTAITIFEA